MSVLGSVTFEAQLDTSLVEKQINELESRKLKPIRLPVILDTSELDKQFRNISFEPIKIAVEADFSRFERQIKEISVDPINLQINAVFDQNEVRQAVGRIAADMKAQIEAVVKVESSQFDPKNKVEFNTSALSQQISAGLKEAISEQIKEFKQEEKLGQSLSAPAKTLLAPLRDIATGAFENIGRNLSDGLSQSMSQTINSELGGVLDEAGKSVGNLFNLLGNKASKAIGVDPDQFKLPNQKITGGRRSQPQIQEIESELKPITEVIQAVSKAFQKTGLDVGSFGGRLNEASEAVMSVVSALNKLESISIGASGGDSGQTSQGFLTGDARTITKAQARGQVDAAYQTLRMQWEELKSLPKSSETRTKFALLVKNIADVEKQIAADIANKDIPESVRRSLGALKASNSKLVTLKNEVEAARLSMGIEVSDRTEKPKTVFSDLELFKVGSNGTKPSPIASEESDQVKEALKNFKRIFREIAAISGIDPEDAKIPKLAFDLQPGEGGRYSTANNQIRLGQDVRTRLASGMLTDEDIDTIAHEIRHAIQLSFGKIKVSDVASGKQSDIELLKGNLNPDSVIAGRINQSVESFKEAFKQQHGKEAPQELIETVRRLEEDAYLFATKALENIRKIFNKEYNKSFANSTYQRKYANVKTLKQKRLEQLNEAVREIGMGDIEDAQFLGEGLVGFAFANQNRVYKLTKARVSEKRMREGKRNQQLASQAGLAPELIEQQMVDGGRQLSVMERLDGRSIADIIKSMRKGEMRADDEIIKELAQFLASLHGVGVAHGDLNLGNVFKTKEGKIKAIDFDASNSLEDLSPQEQLLQKLQDRAQIIGNLKRKFKKFMPAEDIEKLFDEAYEVELTKIQQGANNAGKKRKRRRYKKADDTGFLSQNQIEIFLNQGEQAFYDSPMFDKNMKEVEKRGLVSEASGFLYAGSFMANPALAIGSLFTPLIPAIAPLAATFIGLNNVLNPLIQTIIEAMKVLEPIRMRLEYVGGGKEGGTREAEFVRGVSSNLNTPLVASAQGYANLAVATKGTLLEGTKVQNLFKGIATAASALQLSQEDLNLVLLGFTQVASKGVLSAEEVRQQIAEKLPGAFQTFAEALGVSTQEFNKLLESGSLLAEDVLPLVGTALEEKFGSAAKEASQGFLGAVNRINNANELLKQGFVNSYQGAITFFTNAIGSILEFASKFSSQIAQIFNVALIGIGAQVFVGLTTILTQSGFTAKFTNILVPVFGRIFATLTPFAVGIISDFLDDIFGAKNSVVDNIAQGIYNAVASVILVIDGLIKKGREALGITNSLQKNTPVLNEKDAKEAQRVKGNKVVDTLVAAGTGALTGAVFGAKAGAIGATTGAIFGLVGGLEVLRKVIPSTVIEFASLTLMLVQTYTLGKMALAPILGNLAITVKSLGAAFIANVSSGKVFLSSLGNLTAGLAKSQLATAGMTAAVLLFFAKANFTNELGSKFDKLGDQMSSALNKIAESSKRAGEELSKIPDKSPQLKSKGFDLLLGIGESFGLENGYRTDDVAKLIYSLKKEMALIDARFEKTIGAISSEEYSQRIADLQGKTAQTFATKMVDDNKIKLEEVIQRINSALDGTGILDGSFSQTLAGKNLGLVRDKQSQIDQLMTRRSELVSQSPTDVKSYRTELREIDAQIKALKQERDNLVIPISSSVSGVNQAAKILEEYKKAIKEADYPETIKQQFYDALEPSTSLIDKAKAKMQDLGMVRLSTLNDSALNFEYTLRSINLALAEVANKSEKAFNQARQEITGQQTKDFNTSITGTKNAAFQTAIEERNKALAEVQSLNDAITKASASINDPDYQSTILNLGITSKSSIPQIDDILQNGGLKDGQKRVLENYKSVLELRDKLLQAQTSLNEADLKVKQSEEEGVLFAIDQRSASAKARIEQNTNRASALFTRNKSKRFIEDEDYAVNSAFSEKNTLQQQRKELEERSALLEGFRSKQKIGAEQYEARRREIATEFTVLEKQEADNQLAIADALRAKKIAILESVNKKAEALLATESSNALKAAKEQYLAMGLTQEAQDELSRREIEIDNKATKAKVSNIKSELSAYQKLYQGGDISLREWQEKQLQANQEIANLNLQLTDQKIKEEERYRAIAERNIQKLLQAEDNRIKIAQNTIDNLKAQRQLYDECIDRVTRLTESRYNLSKAISDSQVSGLEIERDKLNRALELSRRLKTDDLDPAVKGEINRQLQSSGFNKGGDSELAILDERNKIEEQIFAKRMEALKAEQEYQRVALDTEQKKLQNAALIATYEAESLKIAAEKSRIEAEGALRIAQIKKDEAAIKSAEVMVELANREASLAEKRAEAANQQFDAQLKITDNAKKAQEYQQKSAIAQLEASEAARKQAASLERVESSAKKIDKLTDNKQDSNTGSSNTGGSTQEWKNPYDRLTKEEHKKWKEERQKKLSLSNQPKMESDWEYASRITELEMTGEIQKTFSSRNIIDTSKYDKRDTWRDGNLYQQHQRQQSPVKTDQTAADANNAQVSLLDGLKTSVSNIDKKLEHLVGQLANIANRPSTLQVSSPNPVSDAAQIYSDMSKRAVRSSGV